MDATGDHHDKQKKLDLERQVLHVFLNIWNFKKTDGMKT